MTARGVPATGAGRATFAVEGSGVAVGLKARVDVGGWVRGSSPAADIANGRDDLAMAATAAMSATTNPANSMRVLIVGS